MHEDFLRTVGRLLARQTPAGLAPWQLDRAPGRRFLPHNPVSGAPYHGINAVWLAAVAGERGYGDTRWLSARQIGERGGRVRPGERPSLVLLWRGTRLWTAGVYNAAQADGLEPERARPIPDAAERLALTAGTPAVVHRAGAATLDPVDRSGGEADIAMPRLAGTPFPGRAGRDAAHPPGSDGHAREALRDGIAGMLLGDRLGIGHHPHASAVHAASWARQIEADPRLVVRAAADAEGRLRLGQGLRREHQRGEAHGRQPEVRQVRTPALAPSAGAELDPGERPPAAYARALREVGLAVDGEPALDGQLRLVRAEGGGHGTGAGTGGDAGVGRGPTAAPAEAGRVPAVPPVKTVAPAPVLGPQDRARLVAEAARRREDRAADLETQQVLAATRAETRFVAAVPAGDEHPQLRAWDVPALGLRCGADRALLVPLRDTAGRLMSLQAIGADGRMEQSGEGRVHGGHHLLGHPAGARALLVTEGYADAAALHRATGLPVAVAGHGGNLAPVVEALRTHWPGTPVHIAAGSGRDGLDAADRAARQAGCAALRLSPAGDGTGRGWNDLARRHGPEGVRAAVRDGLARAEHRARVRGRSLDRAGPARDDERHLVRTEGVGR